MNFSKNSFLVIVSTILIAVGLTVAVWDINFWPADAKELYLDAARRLPQLKHVSQIHDAMDTEWVRWLHGKEGFVLCASLAQRVMGDQETLRPLIMVCIVALCVSALLIFFIAARYWGHKVGLLCYLVFVTSLWPYVYVLFVKHQPLGLMFFLLAVCAFQHASRSRIHQGLHILAGGFLGCALFSSTVSALYFPYYAAVFFFHQKAQGLNIKKILIASGLSLIGFALIFIYFNYPNIAYNVKSYLQYVQISSHLNHFSYNQPILKQWFPQADVASIHGGWIWIFKYFILVMPVMFPVYLGCIVLLLFRWRRWETFAMILISASSPVLASIKGVAQDGANYFTSFIGILMLIGYAVYVLKPFRKKMGLIVCVLILSAHIFANGYVFSNDIFPSRMATVRLSEKIEELGVDHIYTYASHPTRRFMMDWLNPDLRAKLKVIPIENIYQPREGYILIPPVTTDSVYSAGTACIDYSRDIYLNELITRGNLKDYAVASFKTLASSKVWSQEEESLSYRHLILNQFPKQRLLATGKTWILDVRKLRKDMKKNIPRQEYWDSVLKGIRNIGTRHRRYQYNGIVFEQDREMVVNNVPLKMYKVGNPDDSLVMYVYKKHPQDKNLWFPYGAQYASMPVEARDIKANKNGVIINFQFPHSLRITPGIYVFVTYRTGTVSDQNFYRVYVENKKYNAQYIQATRISHE